MAGADAIPGRSMIASQHVLRGNDVKRTRQHSKDTTCWWLWCMAVSCYSPVSILSLMGVLVLSDRCSTNISSTDRTERGNPSAPATLSCVTNRYGRLPYYFYFFVVVVCKLLGNRKRGENRPNIYGERER